MSPRGGDEINAIEKGANYGFPGREIRQTRRGRFTRMMRTCLRNVSIQMKTRTEFICPDAQRALYKVLGPFGDYSSDKRVQMPLEVYRSSDNGTTWTQVSLALTWSSRLRHAMLESRWPPLYLDNAEVRDGRLCLAFRDPWFPYDRQPPKDSQEREGEWLASYDPQSDRWTLKRVRTLDYEGSDHPPM